MSLCRFVTIKANVSGTKTFMDKDKLFLPITLITSVGILDGGKIL